MKSEFDFVKEIDTYLTRRRTQVDKNREHPNFLELKELINRCIDIRETMHLHCHDLRNEAKGFTKRQVIEACLRAKIPFTNEEASRQALVDKAIEAFLEPFQGNTMCDVDLEAYKQLEELTKKIDKLIKS